MKAKEMTAGEYLKQFNYNKTVSPTQFGHLLWLKYVETYIRYPKKKRGVCVYPIEFLEKEGTPLYADLVRANWVKE